MQTSENDVISLLTGLIDTMFSLPVAFTGHDDVTPTGLRTMAAVVGISGAHKGAVVLYAPVEFAQQVASVMFGTDASEAPTSELQDAMGELINVIGGNYKALLQGVNALSLPAVIEGGDYSFRIPGSRLVDQYSFDVGGHPLLLRIFQDQLAAAA